MKFIILAVVLGSTTNAFAIERNSCPKGSVWSLSAGSCVKKKPAPKLSPQEKFDRANDDIEGRGKTPDPKRGVALLEQACSTDKHASSCTLLGFLYSRGRTVKQDDKRAMAFYQQACELKDLEGCTNIGDQAYRVGDAKAARAAFVRSCDMGSGVACMRGADLIDRGIGGDKEPATALPMFKKAMELLAPLCPVQGISDGWSCWVVGYLHEHGKATPKDEAKALAMYRAGCTAGNGNACMSLAGALDGGLGGKPDVDGANKAYERACNDFDNSEACQKIAERLGMAKQDLPHAFKLAERACTLDPKWCGTVAEFYRLGFGIAADDQTAATKYYKQSCDNGGRGWCQKFAERAHDGVGIAKDVPAARAAVESACNEGFGASCNTAASYAEEANEYPNAAILANKGCDLDIGLACWRAGKLALEKKAGTPSPDHAFQLFEKACAKDSPSGCDWLGDMYKDGNGTKQDFAKAFQLWKQGCDGTKDETMSPSACRSLAFAYVRGEGVAKDLKAGVKAFVRACANNQADACQYIYVVNADAGGKREDVEKPLEDSCTRHFEEACLAYSNMLSNFESETDRKKAYKLVEDSCGRGADAACLRQAEMLAFAVGTSKDTARAEKLFAVRCEAGNTTACFGLGQVFELANKQDEAQRLFQQACEADNSAACVQLSYRFYTAKGARWDIVSAVRYMVKSCDLGHIQGCANAGYVYKYGAGAKKDPKQALVYYEKACTTPYPKLCVGLAEYLATGEASNKIDLARSEKLYRAACDGTATSDGEACKGLADLLEKHHKGTPSEIARLRQMAFARVGEEAKDNASNQHAYGEYHRDGMGTMKDPAKAREWFVKSCEGYDPVGCIDAGKSLRATGKADDRERARVYLERACGAGVDEACSLGSAKGPTPVGKKGGCCGGEVAPGVEAGMVILVFAFMKRRRRRQARPALRA
ncbi:MAG: tetratricopeptide repeat protein [Kofleriaceae bacterium]